MRRIMTAREQHEMLTPWKFAADAPSVDLGQRLRELNRRHMLNRTPNPPPSTQLHYPPLSDDEHQERADLQRMSSDLQHRWDNMGPMNDDELEAHRQLNGQYRDGKYRLPAEPHEMSDAQKASRYTGLHDFYNYSGSSDGMSPRELHHYETLKPWADTHFGNMQADADSEYNDFQDYQRTGQHWPDLGGPTSIGGQQDSHVPSLTGLWAAEHYHHGSGTLLKRATDYHDALDNMRTHGPLSPNPETGRYGFQDMEDARNAMRVELQHKGEFRVPSTEHLSKVPQGQAGPGPESGGFINPRFSAGTGGNNVAAREAYQINCQRCTLAADAYHRGLNVEAAPNYQPRGGGGDKEFGDHGIASWFRHPETGEGGTFIDAQDAFPGVPNSPKQWDAMTNHISSWGPGGRGVVAMSYATPGGYARHIINAHVGDDGNVNYYDTQSNKTNADHWRDKVGYRMHSKNKVAREKSRGMWSGEPLRQKLNAAASPLRFLRTDDKVLSPETSQHMIDRGSAANDRITPVDPHDA